MKFITLTTLIILFIPSLVLAKNADISFSGWGETGIKTEEQNTLKGYPSLTYYAAKLQADIKLNKQIDIQIDVKGNSDDNQVDFNEFSFKFDYHDYFKVKVGHLKQPFGYEQQISHANLLTFNRSNTHLAMAKMGYANRSFTIKGYYNYSQKRPDFPYSYALSIFKNNSNNTGLNIKGSRHLNDVIISGYGQYQFKEGRDGLSLHSFGAGSDVTYETTTTSLGLALFILEDPVAGIQNLEQNFIIETASLDLPYLDESVLAATFQTFVAYRFHTNGSVFQSYEPIFLTSVYLPVLDDTKSYEWQVAYGLNSYFTKDVRLRFQVDYIFTQKTTSEESSINGSSVELGLQASF
ncbi:MAG: hypothetical protein HRU38_22105 [Saccharospirillaceae bacterium]|nr:hypothetical protein [Pseudomonadales bacterium]NRB81323.1 hypothetical protein [Saccharospirillaceae bacterium]